MAVARKLAVLIGDMLTKQETIYGRGLRWWRRSGVQSACGSHPCVNDAAHALGEMRERQGMEPVAPPAERLPDNIGPSSQRRCDCLREYGVDRFWRALQAVDDGDQGVSDIRFFVSLVPGEDRLVWEEVKRCCRG